MQDENNFYEVESLVTRKAREEKLLANLADRFMEVENMDDAVKTSLAELGEFTGVDRCIVYAVSGEAISGIYHLYEWCAEGIEPCIYGFKNMDLNAYAEKITDFKSNKVNIVDDIDRLPSYFPVKKDHFTRYGVKSFLNINFISEEKIMNFISFHSVKKKTNMVEGRYHST